MQDECASAKEYVTTKEYFERLIGEHEKQVSLRIAANEIFEQETRRSLEDLKKSQTTIAAFTAAFVLFIGAVFTLLQLVAMFWRK